MRPTKHEILKHIAARQDNNPVDRLLNPSFTEDAISALIADAVDRHGSLGEMQNRLQYYGRQIKRAREVVERLMEESDD
jgi:hypothetical protein